MNKFFETISKLKVDNLNMYNDYLSQYSSYYFIWSIVEILTVIILLTGLSFFCILGYTLWKDLGEMEDLEEKEKLLDFIKFLGFKIFIPGILFTMVVLYLFFTDLFSALYPLIQFKGG